MSNVSSTARSNALSADRGQALSLASALKRGSLGGALAVAANLLVYVVALFVLRLELLMPPIPPASEPATLIAPAVIIASFVPALGAGALYWLLARFTPAYRRVFLIVSVLFLLLSFSAPFALPVALATQITLNLMHLAAGVLIIGAITRPGAAL